MLTTRPKILYNIVALILKFLEEFNWINVLHMWFSGCLHNFRKIFDAGPKNLDTALTGELFQFNPPMVNQ